VQLPSCDDALIAAAAARFGAVAPFGGPVEGFGLLTLHCPADQVFGLAGFLRDQGAVVITVTALEYVFSGDNPLASRPEALVRS
jgi:ATP phosphoribosyltransferase